MAAGADIELITPSLTLGSKNPDFWMSGVAWEMKSPVVAKPERLAYLFRKATRQSENVVFDLRRLSKVNQRLAVRTIYKLFSTSRSIKILLIISEVNGLERLCK